MTTAPATPITDSITWVYELTYGLGPNRERVALFATLEAAQAQATADELAGRGDTNANIAAVEVFAAPFHGL